MFCATPQHMPDELLATTPPIMHESMEDGSGPILYCSLMPCFCLYLASRRFTSPRIKPGSSVISLPSFCGNRVRGCASVSAGHRKRGQRLKN